MFNRELKNVNWGPAIFLIVYQVILLLILPFYFYYTPPSGSMALASFILLYLTGLSITAGYHRFYAHRSYRTNSVMEVILLFFGAMSIQGSALRWAFDHRLHHAHVDTDKDPYSIKKGFWYAHFLWLLEKPATIDPKIVPDLMKNKFVQFQHRYAEILMLVTNVMAAVFVGWLLDDYIGGIILAGWTRIFALHHFTWFINSLAHTWGDRPFCQEQSAVNNFIISLLTFGEGYHNYHHTFANDYRNGVRWYHFDPTKWLIWTLSKIGFAEGLKRVDSLTINKRMVLERRHLLLQKLCDLWYVKKDELEQKVSEVSDRIVAKIADINQLREQYRVLRKECKEPKLLKEIREEIAQVRQSLKQDWAIWIKLSRNILSLKPLPL